MCHLWCLAGANESKLKYSIHHVLSVHVQVQNNDREGQRPIDAAPRHYHNARQMDELNRLDVGQRQPENVNKDLQKIKMTLRQNALNRNILFLEARGDRVLFLIVFKTGVPPTECLDVAASFLIRKRNPNHQHHPRYQPLERHVRLIWDQKIHPAGGYFRGGECDRLQADGEGPGRE